MPENAPKEQERKIATYNELLEVIYIHKIELESLEGDLADMKADIEGEMEYIALKDVGGRVGLGLGQQQQQHSYVQGLRYGQKK